MGLVNKTTINFTVEQSGKLGRSLLTTKPQKAVNIEGLRYMPQQLTTDVVEVTQKAVQQTSASINPAKLQELAGKGLSLNQIATELGVTQSTVRNALKVNNIITDSQQGFRIIKNYFSAATREDKAKALAEIDKYLEQIAKEEVKLHKGSSYEDCLQDVRLRFFELIDKRANGQHVPRDIFKMVRETAQKSEKKEIKTVSLDSLSKNAKPDIQDPKSGIDMVEDNDFRQYYVKNLEQVLRVREVEFIKRHYIGNESYEQLSEVFCFTPKRIKAIIDKAKPRAIELYEKLKTDYYKREWKSLEFEKERDFWHEANGYKLVDGKYAIKKW